MMIKAADKSTTASPICPTGLVFVKMAAETMSAAAKKQTNSAVGGEGTRMEEEGSRANQSVDATSIAISKLNACPRTIPRLLQIAPTASEAKPTGTRTDVSSTAGMFAMGAIKETR